ncbi:hypothetical protein GCM10022243_55120 [Saccharothrix violaceirubra]|uniref:ABC transporter substrate-binding protein n=1 Tax=Saccharothrix violaceirubra TaxID=413306 RepID=A0A7W7WX46_9PSEU|nr:hypothetical protein [Saccharothrix violaceirubra]MBB4967025.1 hypothetical protein [Saccharothrix violaceirubra]
MWRYTDGRGVELTLPRRPERVAVVDLLATSTLWAAGVRPVAAALGDDPSDECLTAVGLRPDTVTRLDTPDDPTPDPALLRDVDLVVDRTHGRDLMLLGDTALPAVGLTLKAPGQSLEDVFAEAGALASALGCPPVPADAVARFEDAKRLVRTASGDRTVGFAFARRGWLTVVDPRLYPWLVTLGRLGVRLAPPRRVPLGTRPDVDLLLVFDEGVDVPGSHPWTDRWHAFDHAVCAELFTEFAELSTC